MLIPGLILQTAHPMYDSDGTMWNIGVAAGPDQSGQASGVWHYVVYKVSCLRCFLETVTKKNETCIMKWSIHRILP